MGKAGKWIGMIMLLMILLVGCSTADETAGNATQQTEQNQASDTTAESDEAELDEQETAPAEEAEQRILTIDHALGTTELIGIPERVVVMDFRYAEELVALGIAPVGIADVAGYEKYMDYNPALTADSVDVGKRSEPNLEVIAQLQPDLIIGNASFMGENYDLLKDIAPTLAFDPFPEQGLNQYDEMTQTFMRVAHVFDKEAEAQTILDELDAHFAEAKNTLIEHGKDGTSFVLGLLMNGKTAASIKLYTANAQAPQILQKLGLQAAYHSEEGAGDGSVNTTVETLIELQEADFIYMMMAGQEDVYETQFKDNAVWKSLQFVQEDRAYKMGKYIWQFGGPLTAAVFVDTVVQALTQ